MNSVCVLLSSYNGEKYIAEQIESLLRQNDVELSILIRDDGSTDGTLSIIRKYAESHKNISVLEDSNIGPAKSFFKLLELAPTAEYYAFCDQDDFWKEEKLCRAVEKIKEKGKSEGPVLYYSNLIISDSDLRPVKTTNIKARSFGIPSKFVPLIDNLGTGCTMVLNRALRDLIMLHLPEDITMHDAWCNIVCSVFGKIVIDEESYIYYRQHGNNTIGMDVQSSLKDKVKRHLRRLKNRSLQPRLLNAQSFLQAFKDELNEHDRKKVEEIVCYKDSFANKIRLLFDFSIHSYSLLKDIRYRLLIIIGEI